MSTMNDSDYMNLLLARIGVQDLRAIGGTGIGPTFYRMFTHVLDRLDRLEKGNDDPEAGPIL